MLALLAALVLSPNRILPEPFVRTPIQPILPVDALEGYKPTTVARGTYWRPGGIVRLTYYYRFEPNQGPTHRDVMGQDGFTEDAASQGEDMIYRANRAVGDLRQVVSVTILRDGEHWPWANIRGPAKVVAVSESSYSAVKNMHRLPELLRPPVPPGFPPKVEALQNAEIQYVRSDPIIPRSYRLTISVEVQVGSKLAPLEIAKQIREDLADENFVVRQRDSSTSFSRRKSVFGLASIQVDPGLDPNGPQKSLVLLRYLFDDSANAPRLVD